MKKAYKAYPETGVRIGNSERLSIVDVERGRTVQGWCDPLPSLRSLIRCSLVYFNFTSCVITLQVV